MNDADLELLSAFFDGEPVDAVRLADLLGDPAAVEELRQLARLRATVSRQAVAPRPEWVAGLRRRLSGGRRIAIPVPMLAAAAVLASIGLGLLSRQALRERAPREAEDQPPVATRTLAFEPGKDWSSRQ